TITSLLMGRPGVIAVLFTYYISKIAMQSEKDFIKYSLNIKPAPGRLNLILGPKKSLIIDDTYNANPMSYEEAISVSNQLPFNYKIAILAGMSELGKLNVKLHRNVSHKINMAFDKVLCIGQDSRLFYSQANSSKYIFFDSIYDFIDNKSQI